MRSSNSAREADIMVVIICIGSSWLLGFGSAWLVAGRKNGRIMNELILKNQRVFLRIGIFKISHNRSVLKSDKTSSCDR